MVIKSLTKSYVSFGTQCQKYPYARNQFEPAFIHESEKREMVLFGV